MSKKKVEPPSEMARLLAEEPTLNKLPKVGDLVTGQVLSVNKKEVLLDINGLMTGVIRGKELYPESDTFANLKIGDMAEATVVEMENERGLLELSFRHAGHQKTWTVLQQYQTENKTVMAKVTEANKGGLLVTVNNVPGFLPVSQLSPEYYPRIQGGDKNKILEKLKSYITKTFPVKVIDVDPDAEKLIVSEKAAWEETQKDTLAKYQVGNIIDGTITAVTDFGAFVEFGEKLEGLIHISELAWQRIENPTELFKVGQKIKAEIIKIEGSKIFLSSKKLNADPWQDINEKYKVGEIIEGTVLKATPFGLFVELDKDIHGLAHISELSSKPITSADSLAKIGDKMKFKIISIEPNEHRLGLSLKALKEKSAPEEKSEPEPEVKKEKEEKKD